MVPSLGDCMMLGGEGAGTEGNMLCACLRNCHPWHISGTLGDKAFWGFTQVRVNSCGDTGGGFMEGEEFEQDRCGWRGFC